MFLDCAEEPIDLPISFLLVFREQMQRFHVEGVQHEHQIIGEVAFSVFFEDFGAEKHLL